MEISSNIISNVSGCKVIVFGTYSECYDTDNSQDMLKLTNLVRECDTSYEYLMSTTTSKKHHEGTGNELFRGKVHTIQNSTLPSISINSITDQIINIYVILMGEQNVFKNISLVYTNRSNPIELVGSFNSSLSNDVLLTELSTSSYTYCVWFNAVSDNPGCLFSNRNMSVLLQQFGTIYNTSKRTFILQELHKLPKRCADLRWNDGNWHMYTHTYDAVSKQLVTYIDGCFFGKIVDIHHTKTPNDVLCVNAALNDVNLTYENVFRGCLSSCVIFDRVLSKFNIQSIHNDGVPCDLATMPTVKNQIEAWFKLETNIDSEFQSHDTKKRLKSYNANNTLLQTTPLVSKNTPNGNMER